MSLSSVRGRLSSVLGPLSSGIEAFFVRFRPYLVYVHIVFFFYFLALLFLPLFTAEAVMDDTPLSNFAVFSNYVLWGLWFPLVLLSVIFTGRSWCGLACPMGASSEWASRIGLKKSIPWWLRSEWTPHVSFLIITILGQTIGVREHPEGVAIVFGGTLLCAIMFGFLYGNAEAHYGKRAWCRHTCPIGLLLGLFSRMGVVQFTPKRKVDNQVRYTERGVCPTMININRKDESRHCIECFKCVYPDKPTAGLKLEFRKPGIEIEKIRRHNPNIMEVMFFFIGIGTALGGFLWLFLEQYQAMRLVFGEWALGWGWSWVGEPAPMWLASSHPERGEVFYWLDFICISAYMLAWAIGTAAVFTVTTFAASFLAGQEGADGTLYSRFLELGYQYAPVCLVSLVISLGSKLFPPFDVFGPDVPDLAKEALFSVGFVWSVYLGWRLLGEQGLPPAKRWVPAFPGTLGSVLAGISWWVAIFGPIIIESVSEPVR
ncbi:MAG: 4Fe-4S binding protein [Candidatus Accumulibacter sp.]|nr:4Fe-4S binding protein [Accumulibacter sp.]